MEGEQQSTETVGTAEEPQAETVDYKAKYEDALKHSREWEKRAKANKGAADELQKLKEAQMSETEKLQAQLSEVTARADALQAAKDRADWSSRVSAETGVPVDVLDLIKADTESDLLEGAHALSERYGAQTAPKTAVPVIIGDGKHAEPATGKSPKADFDAFFKNQFRM